MSYGGQKLGDMQQHQIAPEEGLHMFETRQKEARDVRDVSYALSDARIPHIHLARKEYEPLALSTEPLSHSKIRLLYHFQFS